MESSENHDMKYQDFYIPYADDTTSVSDQTYNVLQLNTNGSLQYIPSETDSFKGGAPFASTAALLQVQETRMSVSITTVNEDEMTLDPSTQSPGYNFSFKTTPRDKKFLLLAIGLVNLFAATSFSLLGPFFPQKAVNKGASQTVVGLIFGVFEFVSFISSPVFGNYISSIGPRFMFTSGIMVSGVCTVLFGVLGTSPEGYQFVLMCFLTRAMDALGTSALATSSYAVLALTFPRYLATVVGYLEMFTGVGMMLGPAIGGALYSIGGYGMPFYVIGSVQFLSGVVGVFVMPSSNVFFESGACKFGVSCSPGSVRNSNTFLGLALRCEKSGVFVGDCRMYNIQFSIYTNRTVSVAVTLYTQIFMDSGDIPGNNGYILWSSHYPIIHRTFYGSKISGYARQRRHLRDSIRLLQRLFLVRSLSWSHMW